MVVEVHMRVERQGVANHTIAYSLRVSLQASSDVIRYLYCQAEILNLDVNVFLDLRFGS
jgi:hypothetical protein